MGKGKSITSSKSAYTDTTNKCISNDTFMSDRVIHYESQREKHTNKFLSQYFRDSNDVLTITRNPLTVDNAKARKNFLKLVSEFEKNNNLKLRDISKAELLYRFLDFTENTNSIIYLKDDARQFMAYRFLYPDIMKLYLYKMFYPSIFDFDITENGSTIKFESSYIDENFKQIYRQIEFMCLTIVYDAMIIAVENCSYRHIYAMKNYKAFVNPYDNVDDIIDILNKEFTIKKEPRTDLVKKLQPSIIFLAKHFSHFYKNRNSEYKLITSILKNDTFYSGKRSDDSRKAVIDAYNECSKILYEDLPYFTMLLNLYYINKRSYLYDLNILKCNVDFMCYSLDGIVTKHHINKMIVDNNEWLKTTNTIPLGLTSVYNNPNCIISNLTPKDYEMLNHIITRSAKTLENYYLINDNKDVPTSKICEIINWIDRSNFTSTIAETITPFKTLETNNVDYEKILGWENPFSLGDGM